MEKIKLSRPVLCEGKYDKIKLSAVIDGQILTTDTPRRFFGQNSFYTTAANRMSRCVFQNAVTAQDVTALYHINREGRA